jgi:hypothetical protein
VNRWASIPFFRRPAVLKDGFKCQRCRRLNKRPVKSKKELLGSLSKSAVVGFRLSKYHRPNVGWVEYNETQQSMELAQPNLRNAERPGINSTFRCEITYNVMC